MLIINMSIGEVVTNLQTDANLSFDAIESLLSRAAQTTLQTFLTLPEKDRLASFGLDDDDGDEDE